MNMERAARLRAEGNSWARVASMMHTTIPILRREWKAAGLPADHRYQSKRRRAIPAETLQRARELRAAGMRWKDVAKELRIRAKRLECAVRKHPVTEPTPELLRAVALRKIGTPWKLIGRQLDMDPKKLAQQIRYLVIDPL